MFEHCLRNCKPKSISPKNYTKAIKYGKFLMISEVTNRRFCSRYRSMLSPFFPILSHSAAHTFFIFSLYYFPNTVKTNNKKRKEKKKEFHFIRREGGKIFPDPQK